MANPQRTIPTSTPCPRCGRGLHERQVGIVAGGEVVRWASDKRFCANGCLYTADEVQE